MFINKSYPFRMSFMWTKHYFFYGVLYALIVFFLFWLIGLKTGLPWNPIGVIGIAVAFFLGFKNSGSHDRTMTARDLWGEIKGASMVFATTIIELNKINGGSKEIPSRIIKRHLGWITALRYQLRLKMEWENGEERIKGMFIPSLGKDYYKKLELELKQYIPKEELEVCKQKTNTASSILSHQKSDLNTFININNGIHGEVFSSFQLVDEFIRLQEKTETIKTFPFPRQFTSTGLYFVWIFVLLLPMSLYNDFSGFAENKNYILFLMGPLLSGVITWVYFLMNKVGDYSENPFEGTYNDVPIDTISREIEILLLDLIEHSNIPKPLSPKEGFLL